MGSVISMKKRNILGVLFILIGVIIIMIPVGWQLYIKHQQSQLMKQIKEEIVHNIEEQNDHPDEDIPTVDVEMEEDFTNLELENEEEIDSKLSVDDLLKQQKVIGIIEIKKINIVFPIVEGVANSNIRIAIGHFKDTAQLGKQGNCVLAGHRGGLYGEFFKNVHKLKKDDVVTITDANGEVYEYLVYDQFVVEPTDMYVIKPIKNETTLTLVTCENNGTKRLIVRCRLKE